MSDNQFITNKTYSFIVNNQRYVFFHYGLVYFIFLVYFCRVYIQFFRHPTAILLLLLFDSSQFILSVSSSSF